MNNESQNFLSAKLSFSQAQADAVLSMPLSRLVGLELKKLIKESPKAPWGNDYKYKKVGSDFTLTCYGSDGREGGTGIEEDITVSSAVKKSKD